MEHLTPTDIDTISKLIYRNGDDIAVSIARSFERLEERFDATESRLYGRISELEDTILSLQNEVIKEKFVYLIKIGSTPAEDIDETDLSDEQFMAIANKEGTVYSQDRFIRQLNSDDIDPTDYWFRII